MLTISEEQLSVFAKDRLHTVARQLADRTIERHPKACAGRGPEEIASALEPDITFAHDTGFRSMRMLGRYVDLCATLGVGFGARERWACDILSRRDLSPATKLDRIEETAIFVLLARRR
ncbi:MAG: hypothetical protein LGR52_15950 [Candidatus Thiosymbion ectosymbiont of Robbea hypermnestra]|nr:hypothetical protein [Candidatus Thiosymbion ectosymbiont of Robbea hypermnestra]